MFRNFITTLSRFRLASALNIIGLSVAFAAFMLIMVQVYYEFTAGTDDPRAERIYRLDMQEKGDAKWSINIYMPIVEQFLSSTPAVEASARWLYSAGSVEIDGVVYNEVKQINLHDDPSDVFQVDMIQGVMASALEPNSMVLSRSAALRFFGTEKAVGKTLKVGRECTVTGVCADLPSNSLLRADIYTSSFNKHYATLFVLLAEGSDPQKIADDFYRDNKERFENSVFGQTRLVAAGDTYFANQEVENSFIERGNRSTSLILLIIAMLVIVIAAINFVNFSTALAPVRVSGLNVRAVFGSTRTSMRVSLIGSAVLFAFVSLGMAILIYVGVVSTSVGGLLKAGELSLGANLPVVVVTVAVGLLVGLAAGIYPAIYCTRFNVAQVLSGGAGVSARGGSALRKALITLQFVVSIALIIAAAAVWLQSEHLKNHPLGYDTHNVVVVSRLYDDKKLSQVCHQVGALSFVRSQAKYNGAFGVYDADMNMRYVNQGDTMNYGGYFVDENFIPTMGIPIVRGRNFMATDPQYFDRTSEGEQRIIPIIVNQAAFDRFGVELDSLVRTRHEVLRVVGVTGDILTRSLYDPASPMAFIKSRDIYTTVFRIDPRTPIDNAVSAIKQIVRSVEPVELWRVEPYDTQLQQIYAKESDLSLLVALFSLLAVLISLSGVFGLVFFETERRRREIALRKVYGSSIGEVLSLFVRRFVLILALGFIIAAPVAWWVLEYWLAEFTYRIQVPWWVFVGALAVVVAITLLTVVVQSWRAARENPIKAINNK